MRRRVTLVAGLLVAAGLAGAPPATAEPGPGAAPGTVSGYRSVVLTDGWAHAADLNDRGEVAGWIGAPYPVVWSGGTTRWLNGSTGGPMGTAAGINDRSEVVGCSTGASGRSRAVRWSRGVRRDLGFEGCATAINDGGLIVGRAEPRSGPPYAVRWQAGRLTSLTRYGVRPAQDLLVSDVNDAGQIVGKDAAGVFRLTGTRLERPPRSGVQLSSAPTITANGDVVGTGLVGGLGWQAVRWTRGGEVVVLGTIGTYGPKGQRLGSTVRDADDRGRVVGDSTRIEDDGWQITNDTRPFVQDHGVTTLLPTRYGWGSATMINNAGVVVGAADGTVIMWIPYRSP